MDYASLAIIIVFAVLANAVFVGERWFLLLRAGRFNKGFAGRLLELAALAGSCFGCLAVLEARLHGAIYGQGWQFYAVLVCLVIVAVFPGFVYRYLWVKPA